jgi:hypothetical protein
MRDLSNEHVSRERFEVFHESEANKMGSTAARDAWDERADTITSEGIGETFPPVKPMPLDVLVPASWRSFKALKEMRSDAAYQGDRDLANAEHYAFARTFGCAGGVLGFAVITVLTFGYQGVKFRLQEIDDQFGTDTLQTLEYLNPSGGGGPVTRRSLEQLKAGADGAADGLALQAEAALGMQGG